MNSTISFAVERFLEQALTMDFYTFAVAVWGLWVLAILLRAQQLRIIGKKIIKVLAWSDWIGIPLLLTVTAPFIAKPILEILHRRDILTYILPTLTLLIGDFAARRRAAIAKEKEYKQLLGALSSEMKTTLKILKANYSALKTEIAFILGSDGHLESVQPPKTLIAQPVTGAIETTIVQAQSLLRRDELLGCANFSANMLKEINHLIEIRRPLLASLSAPHPIQGSSTLTYVRLRKLDEEIVHRTLFMHKSLYVFLTNVNSVAGELATPVLLTEISLEGSGHTEQTMMTLQLMNS